MGYDEIKGYISFICSLVSNGIVTDFYRKTCFRSVRKKIGPKPRESEWGRVRVIKARSKEERHSRRKSDYLVWKGTRTDKAEPRSLSLNLRRSLNLTHKKRTLSCGSRGQRWGQCWCVYVFTWVLQLGNLLWSLVTAQRRIVTVFEEGLFEVSLGNTVCYEQHIRYEHSDYLSTYFCFRSKASRNDIGTGLWVPHQGESHWVLRACVFV